MVRKMATWQVNEEKTDKFTLDDLNVVERALLACAMMGETIESLVEARDEIIAGDPDMEKLDDRGWDIVVCPKCGWSGYRFQTFIMLVNNDPDGSEDEVGQSAYYDSCGVKDCNGMVMTVMEYANGTYRMPVKEA
jgi:hypothetical protein